MTTQPPTSRTPVLSKLLFPAVLSLLLGSFIFYGSEAYQLMGLAAVESTITILGYALGIAEFLVIAILIQRVVQLIILDQLVSRALGTPAPRLLSQLSAIIIYALTLAAIFGVVFKKDLTVVLATFGGASIVMGLALKGVIQDIFSGLTINLDRSINLGDDIRINRNGKGGFIEGRVREISWRTTQILGSDGNITIVPNNQLSTCVITNFSAPQDFFKLPISLTLDSRIPVQKALRILQTAAIEASSDFSPPGAPPPKVAVESITLQGIAYEIAIYPSFKTRSSARDNVLQRVLHHLYCSGLAPARASQVTQQDFNYSNERHWISVLGNQDLFQDLDESARQLLADAARRRALPTGTVLVRGGEIAESMFLVIEGLLMAEEWRRKPGQAATHSQIMGPGHLINASSMLAGGTSPVTIRTRSTALIYEIDMAAIEILLRHRAQYVHNLSRRVAEQLIEAMVQGQPVLSDLPGAADIDSMQTRVLKNLRRTFAHLPLP